MSAPSAAEVIEAWNIMAVLAEKKPGFAPPSGDVAILGVPESVKEYQRCLGVLHRHVAALAATPKEDKP